MKNFRIYTVVALIAFLAVSACNTTKDEAPKSGVEYYRNLLFSETPYDLERGTHALTEEEAATVNSYKFTWEDGRLVSVEYVRGDELLTYGSLGAPRITYTYDGNSQVKAFFNKEGDQVASGGVYKPVYTLDEEGVRIALHFFDEEGKPVENRNNIHRYEWDILEDGLVRELRYNLQDEETVMNPFCPFYELRFKYDGNGYVTAMMNYQADTLYNCTAENCGDIGVSYFEFKNNDHGDLLSFSVHNTVGQLSNLYWGWAKRINVVDDNGYPVEREVYDQDDELIGGNNVPVNRYSYDEHGALVEVTNLDGDRNVIESPSNGVAVTRYTYDEKGNRTGSQRFDSKGVEIVSE